MATKKPKIVIIGAGMAGLTAAVKLHSFPNSADHFDLAVVEGSTRIGGRISSTEFYGDRIEQGATWIHGIRGSPVYQIARETGLLQSDTPWECMDGDGIRHRPVTVAEGGHVLSPCFVEPVSRLFKNLMDTVQGKEIAATKEISPAGDASVGGFLRRGLEAYWGTDIGRRPAEDVGNWSRKSLEDRVFAMLESTQRTYTSAADLTDLDCAAEREYVMFPGEEITIARGYSSVVESLASLLPPGTIQLGRRVTKIEWQGNGVDRTRPVNLQFSDRSTMSADHVIVTVSLGVLKQGIRHDSPLFHPPLPRFKTAAISKLGYGVVDKVFLRITPNEHDNFPFLQMVFHPPDSHLLDSKIPPWIRATSSLSPIYRNSKTLLSWFTGADALALESLPEDKIIAGFSATLSNLLRSSKLKPNWKQLKIEKVVRTQWGSNPLFLGSYSYVAVGSSTQDMEILGEPLPRSNPERPAPPLQILFAGEATHSTHYSTTHGAYYSGIREANRLLKHYNH